MLYAAWIQPLELPFLPLLFYLDISNILGLFFFFFSSKWMNEIKSFFLWVLYVYTYISARKHFEGKNSFRISAFAVCIYLLRRKAWLDNCTWCKARQLYSFAQHPSPFWFFESLKWIHGGEKKKKKSVFEWELSPSKLAEDQLKQGLLVTYIVLAWICGPWKEKTCFMLKSSRPQQTPSLFGVSCMLRVFLLSFFSLQLWNVFSGLSPPEWH